MRQLVGVAVVVVCLLPPCLAGCATALDCSFAGRCVSGSCVCEPGFVGDTCAALNHSTPIPVRSGFNLTDHGYWVWGSQVIAHAGVYHMVASVYPSDLPFDSHWLTNAQIAHATAPSPLGPFELQSLALKLGNASVWDRSIDNPKVVPAGDEFAVFYVGDTYPGPVPTPSHPDSAGGDPQGNQMIGMATSRSMSGPWDRVPTPVLAPRPNKWDSRMVTNPSVVLLPNGTLFMVYKGSSSPAKQTRVCLGVASAPSLRHNFTRLRDDPIFDCPPNTFHFEDPCVFYDAHTDAFHLIVKDFRGTVTHAGYSGAHAVSTDGVNWSWTKPALAYTTTHAWSDGKTRQQKRQERPQVLLGDDGSPTHAYFATDTGLNGEELFWNMVMPLR